jgi:hypothetical protein
VLPHSSRFESEAPPSEWNNSAEMTITEVDHCHKRLETDQVALPRRSEQSAHTAHEMFSAMNGDIDARYTSVAARAVAA